MRLQKWYQIRNLAILQAIAILAAAGCGRITDTSLRFEMERRLNRADRLQEQYKVKSPDFSDEDLQALVNSYEEVSRMIAPARDSAEVRAASDDKKQAWSISSLAQTRIGTLYFDKKMYEKSYGIFNSLLANPAINKTQENSILSYMALCQENLGNYSKAAELYDSLAMGYLAVIIPANPNMDALDAPLKAAEMWTKEGDSNKFEEALRKARAYYDKIIRDYPGTLTSSAAAGKEAASFLQEGKYPEAIAVLRTVKDDSSGHVSPGVMLMIADIYMSKLQDFPAAEKTYREFANVYPQNIEIGTAILGLGLSLFQQAKYPDARKAVEGIEKVTGIKQNIVAQAYYLTALSYEKQGKWELAQGQFDIIQTSFPGMDEGFEAVLHVADYYRTRGQTELTQKAFENAISYIEKYLAQNESDPQASSRAIGYLVRAYSENGNLDKASEQLILLNQRYPESPEGRFAPLRLSEIYENALHDTAQAIVWLKKFVNDNPNAGNIREISNHIDYLEQLRKSR